MLGFGATYIRDLTVIGSVHSGLEWTQPVLSPSIIPYPANTVPPVLSLLDIVTITSSDTIIKLIVSSLDYVHDGMARLILSKALTATSESARLYTASFMRVLLRARVRFLANWGMEMLVMQLYDQSKAVAMEALSVLSEACEEEVSGESDGFVQDCK